MKILAFIAFYFVTMKAFQFMGQAETTQLFFGIAAGVGGYKLMGRQQHIKEASKETKKLESGTPDETK